MHGYCLSLYANVGNTIKQARVKTMELKAHLYRLENIKAIHDEGISGWQNPYLCI